MAKSMGAFIAALRTAAGMTQRDLADKLNVSDKTVSRWERDINAPDLSLLPIIADLFDVTCDELLRGERVTEQRREEDSRRTQERAQEQWQRLLLLQRNRTNMRTVYTLAMAVLGVVAAMTLNFGFLRARVGFLLALVFFVGALAWQAVVWMQSLSALSGMDTEITQPTRDHVIKLSLKAMGAVLILFAMTLPLVTQTYDPYQGLMLGSWLVSALWYGLLALAVVAAGYQLITHFLHRRGMLQQVWSAQSLTPIRRKQLLVVPVTLVILLTVLIPDIVSSNRSYLEDAKGMGTTFDTLDAFLEYVNDPSGEVHTDDFYPEETVELGSDPDNPSKPAAVYTYRIRNINVYTIEWNDKSPDGLPVTVYTHNDMQQIAEQRNFNTRISQFTYLLIIVLGIAAWFIVGWVYRKREQR